MIYSPRAQPEVNKSHIPEVPKNNRLGNSRLLNLQAL